MAPSEIGKINTIGFSIAEIGEINTMGLGSVTAKIREVNTIDFKRPEAKADASLPVTGSNRPQGEPLRFREGTVIVVSSGDFRNTRWTK